MSIRKWLGGIIRPDGVETEEVESEKVSIPDTSSDPTSNGEITRNGPDIKVHSGDGVLSVSNIGSGSGGGSPGGSDNQIQYNDGGSFGGIASFTFGGTNITSMPDIDSFLTLVDQASNPTSNGQIGLNGSDIIVYTGGTTLNLSNVGTSGFSNEDAQDAVGGVLSSDFTYDDANDTINMSPHVGTSDAHHADPTAGTGITDEGTNKFGVASGGITDTELGVESFSYDPGMTQFGDTSGNNKEINRIVLQSGETLVVERIELRQLGGGSNSNVTLDVRDVTGSTTIGSQTMGGTTKDPGSSGTANTVIIRISNSTGGAVDVSPRVQGYITGV